MAYQAKKTEHTGAKMGRGAYWGRKVDAKKESRRRRREGDKKNVLVEDARRKDSRNDLKLRMN